MRIFRLVVSARLKSPTPSAVARTHARMHAMQLSPVERCIIHSFGGTLPEFHAAFTPPPPHLRMACDHNDGSLLGWKYGEQPRCPL